MLERVNRGWAALAGFWLLIAGATMGCGPCRSEVDGAARQAAADAQLPVPELIVLVSIDTLRADHLGTYGYERFTSPVLDELAREGTVFEDASATAPWTLPSHASILTGSFPHRHGVTSMKTALPSDVPTLASVLSRAGWETAAVVNSLWLERDSFGLTRDFDEYLHVPELAERRAPTTWVTDQAIDWMTRPGRGKLFLFVHYYDVHADYASEPAYEKLFVTPYSGKIDGSSQQLLRANLDDDYLEMCRREEYPERCTFGTVDKPWTLDSTTEPIHLDDDDVRHLVDLYDAGVRQMDTELGRLFVEMRKAGVFEKALIVITSDHGEEFMEHGHVDHFLPTWQELLHVPLIVHGPGVPSGLRVDAPVSSVDIAPTLLSLARVQPPGDMEGVDLTPFLRGGSVPGLSDRLLYGEAAGGLSYELVARGYFPVYRSLRRGDYKVVWDSKHDRYRLFDLAQDPGEQRDLSGAEPDRLAALRSDLERRHAESGAAGESAAKVELSDEQVERLRSLGYLQ